MSKFAINTRKQSVATGVRSLKSAMLQARIAEALAKGQAVHEVPPLDPDAPPNVGQANHVVIEESTELKPNVAGFALSLGAPLRLSAASQLVFAEALLNPPDPNDTLNRAARRHAAMLVDADTGVTKLG